MTCSITFVLAGVSLLYLGVYFVFFFNLNFNFFFVFYLCMCLYASSTISIIIIINMEDWRYTEVVNDI